MLCIEGQCCWCSEPLLGGDALPGPICPHPLWRVGGHLHHHPDRPAARCHIWAAGAYEGLWTGTGARRLLGVEGGGFTAFARRVLLEAAAGGGGGAVPFAFTEAGTSAVNSATASVFYNAVDALVRAPVPPCLHLAYEMPGSPALAPGSPALA